MDGVTIWFVGFNLFRDLERHFGKFVLLVNKKEKKLAD